MPRPARLMAWSASAARSGCTASNRTGCWQNHKNSSTIPEPSHHLWNDGGGGVHQGRDRSKQEEGGMSPANLGLQNLGLGAARLRAVP